MNFHAPLCIALLAAAAAAQGFTSPAGYVSVEGSSNHTYILFKYNDLRWQQLDQTSVGTPNVVNRISWRRDAASAANPVWAARTIDIEAVLSDAVPPAGISETYDANYDGTPTIVFFRRSVNLPDWTQMPTSSPAPWDFNLQLDTPWFYAGLKPFLWELRVTNNTTNADYGNDFQSTSGSISANSAGTAIGTGCIATGQTTAMSLAVTIKNQGIRFHAAFNVTRAAASAPALLFIAGSNSNLPVPGLCANLVAMPTLMVTMGAADPTGLVPELPLDIPFSASLVGAAFFSQALSVDVGQPGIPVALSNGRQSSFPAFPAAPNPVTRVYGYRLQAGTMRAPSTWTGGLVTLFD